MERTYAQVRTRVECSFGVGQARPNGRNITVYANGNRTLDEGEQEVHLGNVNVNNDRLNTEGRRTDARSYCAICMEQPLRTACTQLLTCQHEYCKGCIRTHVRTSVLEARTEVQCPLCKSLIHPEDIKRILHNANEFSKYEKFMIRRVLLRDPDTRWCPAPNCEYAVLAPNCTACPCLQCEAPGCGTSFCYNCRRPWHPGKTCDQLQAEIFPERGGSPVKLCPNCQVHVEKQDWTCNHMECTLCGVHFCWTCMKLIDSSGVHFFSTRNTCSMYGEKPTARYKKQLYWAGLLLGAPIGVPIITLVAAVGIVLGLPVVVGVQIQKDIALSRAARSRRHFIVGSCVAASIVLAPVVAVISIPTLILWLLMHVYVILPTALCREELENNEGEDMNNEAPASADARPGSNHAGEGNAVIQVSEGNTDSPALPAISSHLTEDDPAREDNHTDGPSTSINHQLEDSVEIDIPEDSLANQSSPGVFVHSPGNDVRDQQRDYQYTYIPSYQPGQWRSGTVQRWFEDSPGGRTSLGMPSNLKEHVRVPGSDRERPYLSSFQSQPARSTLVEIRDEPIDTRASPGIASDQVRDDQANDREHTNSSSIPGVAQGSQVIEILEEIQEGRASSESSATEDEDSGDDDEHTAYCVVQ